MFMIMPPTVLPAATTLNTVPKECFGTTSNTKELILVSHANDARTVQNVNTIDVFKPVTFAINGDKGIRQAQPNITHILLLAGVAPRFIIAPESKPPSKLPIPAAA